MFAKSISEPHTWCHLNNYIFNSSDVVDGFSGFGFNTMPADALAPKVARASVGTVLVVSDRQHVLLFQSRFHILTGDPLHSRAACTQPCNVNAHSRAHCSPGARLCEQWGHGCVNNWARLCASARLCRGSPVILEPRQIQDTIQNMNIYL